jgi:hypothetical protein
MVHRYFGFVRFAGRPCSFTNMQSLTVGWADLPVPVQLTSIDAAGLAVHILHHSTQAVGVVLIDVA